jgi:hypothetical protein
MEQMMSETTDILITGSGAFAARILFDLAATAQTPTRIAVAGRNAQRLAWLETASRARAHMFGRPVNVNAHVVDLNVPDEIAGLLAKLRPSIILQAASLQPGSVISAQGNAWSKLVAAGGLSASAVFQAMLSARVARVCVETLPAVQFINACFPDVANSLIAALGLPITCGIGNIQILAHAFGGARPNAQTKELKILAHYQNLAAWRLLPAGRLGVGARVWLDGTEIADVFRTFRDVQLTPEPVIDISGAAAAPLLLALAHRRDWQGHAPGPEGLPGGYPVRTSAGRLTLDLPPGLTRETAIRWNLAHEEANGLVVDPHGRVQYKGRLHDELAAVSPELAKGFHVRDLDAVFVAMQQLREKLVARSV